MIYYHATLKENVFEIQKSGLKAVNGVTYLCKTEKECLMFFYIRPMYRGKEIAVIPVDIDESTVTESFDHDKNYIPAKAFYIDYDIPADKIPPLDKIALYEILN